MIRITCDQYRKKAGSAIHDKRLQKMLGMLQNLLGKGAQAAYKALPEGEALREKGRSIRKEAVENLDILLVTLAENIRKQGGRVYFAEDAEAAVQYCLSVAREHDVKSVVKGKSMVTEEIGLNRSLEETGIEVSETDLGEYIIQLAGEHPSHIIAPAIHKSKEEVGELFSRHLGIPYTDDPPTLTRIARAALREKFLNADMGITGVNLACAETGHMAVLSNEGNIRMATTLPRVHLAFMGMERITARLEDHEVILRLLTRAASAQKTAGYVSYIGGPRQADQVDGPEEFHLVIIDNGRSKILADKKFREILSCLRCGACLNVCPVYGKIGGHAYGSPYPGPVGSVVTPLLFGVNPAKNLCQGESLCGACKQQCPIHIDIPRMLLELRALLADGDKVWQVRRGSTGEKIVYKLWSLLISNRRAYDLFLKAGAFMGRLLPENRGMIKMLPPPFSGWTKSRDLRPPAKESFTSRWKQMNP